MDLWQNFKKPIVGLAPMHNVTTYLFRELQCFIAKPDVVYTEFVSAEGLARVPEKLNNQLRYSKAQKPIVAQLFGIDPDSFKKAITAIHTLDFDGVDINMGCPANKLIKIGGGAALINNYERSSKILNASLKTASQLNIPISVKTRIVADDKLNDQWFNFLADYSLNAITIHGRIINQEHHGIVDWTKLDLSAKIIKKKGIIVFGNGGIQSREEGNVLAAKYNLDGFLIGQSAIGNPYVFSENLELSADKRSAIISMIIELIKDNSDVYPVGEIRRFIFLSLKGWPNTSVIKQCIAQATSVNMILDSLANFARIHQ